MIIFCCMQGVIAGIVYNNLRPLDMAANKEIVSRFHILYIDDNFPLH
jgi:hypothetical protein